MYVHCPSYLQLYTLYSEGGVDPQLMSISFQVPIHQVLQNNLALLLRRNPRQFQSSCIALRLPSHPPRHQRQDRTKSNEPHGDGERNAVARRILALENLRANGTPNLPVAVDEPDCKG